jgi:hypothetical protein
MPRSQTSEIEPLDLANVMEIKKIRDLLIDHPDLLSMLELLILVCNKRISQTE